MWTRIKRDKVPSDRQTIGSNGRLKEKGISVEELDYVGLDVRK